MLRFLRLIWRYYRDTSLIVKMTVAFVLGLAAAIIFGPSAGVVSPAGDLFLRLLEMIVIPIIMITLIDALSSPTSGKIARIASKSVVYYLLTTAGAVVISLAIAVPVRPGNGLDLPGKGAKTPEAPSLTDQLLGIVPENGFQALVQGKILPLIFLALIIGATLGGHVRL